MWTKQQRSVYTHAQRSLNSRQPWGSKSTWHNAVYKGWQILTSHGLWGQMELNQHLFGLTRGMHSDLAEEYLTGSALPLNLNLSIHFLLSYAILLYPPVQTPKSFFPSYPGDLFYLVSHSSLTMKYRMCQICCVVPFILNASNSGDFKSEIFNLG